MHVAVVLTLFVSLTLVGLGVLLNQQAEKAADHWGSELQITSSCARTRRQPACTARSPTPRRTRSRGRRDNPEVAATTSSRKDRPSRSSRSSTAGKFEGQLRPTSADDMPESVWIDLKDPNQFEGITSAVQGLDGVSGIRDAREPSVADLQDARRAEVGRPRHAASWCSPRCCWSPTRSGWRRSRAAARSASCGWSAPRRSTSRCRSSSRRW
jgi:cell division protein FtsX